MGAEGFGPYSWLLKYYGEWNDASVYFLGLLFLGVCLLLVPSILKPKKKSGGTDAS
jgi:hypothetical protein